MQGGLLFPGPRVGRTAIGSETSLVADSDGVLVVVAGMGADEILMTRLVHMTIAGNVIMVAGEPETGIVTGYQVLNGEPAVAARRAAIHAHQILSQLQLWLQRFHGQSDHFVA